MNLDRIVAIRNNKTVYKDGTLCPKVFEERFSKAADYVPGSSKADHAFCRSTHFLTMPKA